MLWDRRTRIDNLFKFVFSFCLLGCVSVSTMFPQMEIWAYDFTFQNVIVVWTGLVLQPNSTTWTIVSSLIMGPQNLLPLSPRKPVRSVAEETAERDATLEEPTLDSWAGGLRHKTILA